MCISSILIYFNRDLIDRYMYIIIEWLYSNLRCGRCGEQYVHHYYLLGTQYYRTSGWTIRISDLNFSYNTIIVTHRHATALQPLCTLRTNGWCPEDTNRTKSFITASTVAWRCAIGIVRQPQKSTRVEDVFDGIGKKIRMKN